MPNNGKGLAVAGLVLGIISVVFLWVPFVNTVALICGIIGIVCSAKGRAINTRYREPSCLATAGLVLSIIGTALSGIGFLSCTMCSLCVGLSGGFANNVSVVMI